VPSHRGLLLDSDFPELVCEGLVVLTPLSLPNELDAATGGRVVDRVGALVVLERAGHVAADPLRVIDQALNDEVPRVLVGAGDPSGLLLGGAVSAVIGARWEDWSELGRVVVGRSCVDCCEWRVGRGS
jgi:hypothetical protein